MDTWNFKASLYFVINFKHEVWMQNWLSIGKSRQGKQRHIQRYILGVAGEP